MPVGLWSPTEENFALGTEPFNFSISLRLGEDGTCRGPEGVLWAVCGNVYTEEGYKRRWVCGWVGWRANGRNGLSTPLDTWGPS